MIIRRAVCTVIIEYVSTTPSLSLSREREREGLSMPLITLLCVRYYIFYYNIYIIIYNIIIFWFHVYTPLLPTILQ